MSDNLKRKGPEDPKKINLNQSWEITYWTGALSISEAKLREAVAAVGVMVVDVRAWLNN
ncbi:DUF3606 domain-containing protein [Moritella yayanosii]|uniref:DUF3606 domain-containing protein n=1 Tax=Moritella yayanosii TaxID=69539 RepID=A0A330LR22_9GAMM|nr:DUF3606 domain-containing protein [Moritella yayanosii]SQD76525.1 conserved protein of unknown function [Moritella yayanosii]